METIIMDCDGIVLLDTCTFINYEKSNVTDECERAMVMAQEFDFPIAISDLTMVELILGCPDEEKLEFHMKFLKEKDFIIFGRFDDLKTYVDPIFIEDIIKDKSINTLKDQVRMVRNKVLFPVFRYMFIVYITQMLIILNKIDKMYWDEAFYVFNDLIFNQVEGFNSLLKETFDDFFDDKNQNKLLLSETFLALLSIILPRINQNKYTADEIKAKLGRINVPFEFTKIFKNLKLNKDINRNDFCYIKPMMQRMKKEVKGKSLEGELTIDAINFAVIYMLSTGGKFHKNDLIDLMNISFKGYDPMRIFYFTNDIKWKRFAEIEHEISPCVSFLEIFY